MGWDARSWVAAMPNAACDAACPPTDPALSCTPPSHPFHPPSLAPPVPAPAATGKYGEWRFDKRTYAGRPPPRNLGEPPEGMKNELVRHLIHAINEASSKIPGARVLMGQRVGGRGRGRGGGWAQLG